MTNQDSGNNAYGAIGKALFSKPLLNFIMILLGMTAAYYTTINAMKIDLTEKAESAFVEKLDIRLSRLEVLITEGSVGKDAFYKFVSDVEARLARIEFYVSERGEIINEAKYQGR